MSELPVTYLLLFSDEFSVEEGSVELVVTNGFDKLFRVPLDYEYVQMHREKLCITGSWQAYFELLCDATKSDSQIKVRFDKKLSFEPS